MKLLYKPFGIIAGMISARVGRSIFKSLWRKIDADDPPEATASDGSLPKVVGAAVLKAATMAGVAAAFERASASTFHYFTGIWPDKSNEEKQREKEEKEKKREES
jgi:hypothetical protein